MEKLFTDCRVQELMKSHPNMDMVGKIIGNMVITHADGKGNWSGMTKGTYERLRRYGNQA